MILMQAPQFPTQDDRGYGNGVAPIKQWIEAECFPSEASHCSVQGLDLDLETEDALHRLQIIFRSIGASGLTTTELHDLTCFILHRMLRPTAPASGGWSPTPVSNCVRKAIALHMLTIHGPTYFSHAGLQCELVLQIQAYLELSLNTILHSHGSLAVWLLSVGMVTSESDDLRSRFVNQARTATIELCLTTWDQVECHLHTVLWYASRHAEELFRQQWNIVWATEPT